MSNMTEAILYKTTNKKNGKWYVGVHAQKGVEFDGYLGSGYALKEALKKHGNENFEREVLFSGAEDYMYDLEEMYLKTLWKDSNNYNICPGGRGLGSGWTHTEEAKRKIGVASRGNKHCIGRVISEDQKRAISEANTGKIVSEETRKKLSVASTGKGGWEHTDEAKEKIRLSGLGRKMSEENKKKLRKINKGNKYCLGRELSQDDKDKISKSHRNRSPEAVAESTRKMLETRKRNRLNRLKLKEEN